MQCPICDQPMKQVRQDTSNNFETGQKYSRTIYHCDTDDAWANTEIPLPSETPSEKAE